MENGGSSAFPRTLKKGAVVTFISAHAEGKLLFPADREKRILKEMVDNDQIVFRFVDDRGKYAGYPWNPTGTTFNIAALCNRDGNVFGVHPHAELAFCPHLQPACTLRPDRPPL